MEGQSVTQRRPDYGKRLLNKLFDERAQQNHQRPYASIPVSTDLSAGYRDISYWQFANAINRCSRWIQSHHGLASTREPLVYAGPNDLRYQILCLAATKSGHVMFFVSPRNSVEAHLALLEQAKTNRFIVPTDGAPAFIEQVARHISIQRFPLPSLDELLDDTPVEHIPFTKTFNEMRMKPWVILHTSGSTGTPKIVTLRHGYPTTLDAYWLLDFNEMAHRCGNMRIFAPFPAFHVAGIIYSLMVAPFADSTLVLPPTSPLTAEVVDAVHFHGRVETSSIPPSLIVELTKKDEFLQRLKHLNGLTFAGGPLARPVGDALCQHMPLYTSLGATEFGSLPMRPKDREDWAYFNFSPEVGGLDFRETGNGGFYELVIVRDQRLDLFQAVFVTFPHINEYHTKDLFSMHPTKPGLWRYEGRLDDVIVLSNGEKLNPVTMEGIITSCPDVAGCVVFGQGRFQTGVIVQPANAPQSQEEYYQLLQTVWPFIERANESCVKHGRISRELVLITSPDRVLPRAPKGTIQRQKANDLYAKEIENAYNSLSTASGASGLVFDLNSTEAAVQAILAYFQDELGYRDMDASVNFFKLGVDSLTVLSLVRAIQQALPGASQLEAKDVYDHPTVNGLVAYLQHKDELDNRDSDEMDRESWNAMEKVFQNAVKDLPGYKNEDKGPFRYWKSVRTRWMVPPDGGTTAWLQVLGSFLINFNNWGLANSFGVFQAYFETNLLSSHSPSSIAWIGTLQASLILIIGVISGPLFDKGYFTPVLIGSSLVLVFSLFMLSLATEYYQVMLTWGVLGGVCTGLLYIPSVAMIPQYFTTHRGFALGLGTAGGSFGGIIYPIVVRRVLNTSGFGWACRAIAFICLITLAVAILVIKPTALGNKKPTRQLFDRSVLRDLPFVTFMIAAFLLYAGFMVPFFLTPTFALEGLDIPASEDTAFYLLAVPNVAQLLGRTIPALISDSKWAGPELLLLGAEVLAPLFALCWIAVHNLGGFVVFLLFYGFVSGMIATLPAAVLPYVSPSLAVLGTRLGMVYACAGIGALIGTPIALAADGTDPTNFLGAQLWTGLTLLAGAGFYSYTAWEARKRRKVIDLGFKGSKGAV